MTVNDVFVRDPRPTISVIMANYNGAAYLADAIASVQNQTLREIEIIVSDDASTDDSVAIVTRLMANDSRIRLVRGEQNNGPGAARNKALAIAVGEWIAVVDSDDVIYPQRLATLIEAAEQDCADIVADDLIQLDQNNTEPAKRLLTGRWRERSLWVNVVEYVRLNKIYGPGPGLGYLKPIFRASVLRQLTKPYDESLRNSEDFDLVLRLLHAGARMRVHPFALYIYRKHSGSLSHRLSETALTALFAANRHFLDHVVSGNSTLRAALIERARSIETAVAYERILSAMKARSFGTALAIAINHPKGAALLRLPIGVRLRRLIPHQLARRTRRKPQMSQAARLPNKAHY